jgi:outer membrane autotransporter protein
MTGSSNVTELVNDTSSVLFAAPTGDAAALSSYMTLTAVRYRGANGAIGLNTFLGSDSSPSDRLVIDGGQGTGTTTLRFTRSGGLGALTTGNGILVVDAINGATTASGAFAQGGLLVAGPYEYTLHQGGPVAGASQDWFLRSTISCNAPDAPRPPCPAPTPTPTPTPGPTPTPTPTPSPTPSPTPTPTPTPTPDPTPTPASLPNYRAETALYTSLPALGSLLARAQIGNLHDRVGEEEQLRGLQLTDDDETVNGAWARIFGWKGRQSGGPLGVYGSEGPTFDYDLEAIQAGVDLYRREDDKGRRNHAGIYASYGRASGTTYHVTGSAVGTDEIKATSVGGYWTHFWRNGSYLDAVGQYSWYDATARSVRLPALSGKGTGWAASLEGARPFPMRGDWVLEPQLQVSYQAFNRREGTDAGGRVVFDGDDSLIGRLGLRAARTWYRDGRDALETTGWLRLNLFHEFVAQPRTTFESDDGPVVFQANLGKDWAELNAGATRQMSRLMTLYGGLGYQRTLDKNDSYAWTGRFGVRFNW